MKIFECLLLLMFISTIAWGMQSMNTVTGYGYFTWNGQIISKYHMNPGTYNYSDNLTYTDISQSQFNSVVVNTDAWDSYVNSVRQ